MLPPAGDPSFPAVAAAFDRAYAAGMAAAAALAALAVAAGWATLGPARVGFFAGPLLTACAASPIYVNVNNINMERSA